MNENQIAEDLDELMSTLNTEDVIVIDEPVGIPEVVTKDFVEQKLIALDKVEKVRKARKEPQNPLKRKKLQKLRKKRKSPNPASLTKTVTGRCWNSASRIQKTFLHSPKTSMKKNR